MENINYEYFKNICRMCMSNCHTNFNKNSIMLDIFYKLTDVQFETNNELPQQICLKCYDFINEIHAFSITCKQTHSVLMECLNDYKNIGIKQEPGIIVEKNEAMEIKDELIIEEHKIEFIKVEVDNDCETNDVLNKDVTDRTYDLLPPLLTKICTENVEDHISENPSVSEIINNHKCDQCEKSFRDASYLLRHIRVHSGERPYKCNQCGKSFAQSGTLIKHERVHSGERPYQCDRCGKSFAESGKLKIHKLVHSGARPYKCDHCEKSFNQSGHLIMHKRVHSGDRPYKCKQCEKSFAESGHLIRHKRVHSGERPYQCDQCEKSFATSGTLTKHKRVHSGERPYKCEHCEKSFSQLSSLNVHKRVHSGERPYKCDHCEKTFNRLDVLKSHKRLHNHNVD